MKDTTAKLERREDEHCRQIERLQKDNAVLRALVKAEETMRRCDTIESLNNLNVALKAAEAAMDTKPESLYPSNDVMYTKGEG